MNLMMLLEMAAASHGDRVALVSGASRLTASDLYRAAAASAKWLRASEAKHAALLDIASPALPIALFGAAWAGVPFVPLNYRLTSAEIDSLLARVAPAALVTDAERATSFGEQSPGRVIERGEFLGRMLEPAAERLDDASWSMEPDEIALLLFTSGTTGRPKAAVLRQRHLVSYILGSVEFASAGEEEATLVSVPPYHIAGMAALLSSLYAGRKLVQLPQFDAREWLRLARAEHVTHAFVVPTMLARIIDALEADGGEPPRLRALAYGGGKMPLPVIERAMRIMPSTAFTNAYGLTETSSTITLLGPDEHRAAAASGDPAIRRRLVSVGRALPGVELEVRGDDGKPVGTGERGEIFVRGEQVSGEYLERGSQLTRDGFFPTRDGGYLDDEGYLYLEGRIDDVIVRGGENLSPGEIEEVLLEHPAVRDCAVVGIPSVQWGESVAAAVVLGEGRDADEAELQTWVKERLRSSRVPERIVFRSELPYNETGKLLRRVIKAELAGESASGAA